MDTLSLNFSDDIKVLGIFGRFDQDQEKYFQDLSEKYSQYPPNDDSIGIFNHLSLIINTDLNSKNISPYQNILNQLRSFLPLQLNIIHPIIIDNQDLALSFNRTQTQAIHQIISQSKIKNPIHTHYIKVVRFVPPHLQPKVIDILSQTKSITITNFVLCANSVNQSSIIAST